MTYTIRDYTNNQLEVFASDRRHPKCVAAKAELERRKDVSQGVTKQLDKKVEVDDTVVTVEVAEDVPEVVKPEPKTKRTRKPKTKSGE